MTWGMHNQNQTSNFLGSWPTIACLQSIDFSRHQGQFVVQNCKLRLAIWKPLPIMSVLWPDFKVHPAWVYLSCLKPAPLSNSWRCCRVPPEQSCAKFKICHPFSLQQHLNPHWLAQQICWVKASLQLFLSWPLDVCGIYLYGIVYIVPFHCRQSEGSLRVRSFSTDCSSSDSKWPSSAACLPNSKVINHQTHGRKQGYFDRRLSGMKVRTVKVLTLTSHLPF